jgi:Fe2+ or Zn2+ uptake regulation protein
MERITCQKQIIIDYLKSVTTHPSVEEIYLAVRKRLPRISRGTVYRILKNLRAKREILEIFYEVSHYDGNVEPHGHFICKKCGKIFDVFEKFSNLKVRGEKIGEVEEYQVYFYGLCKSCQGGAR